MESSTVATTPTPVLDPLKEFLEQKFQQALDHRFESIRLIDILKEDPNKLKNKAYGLLNEMNSGLVDLIISDQRFLGDTVKMIRTLNGRSGFYPYSLGPTLLQRTFDAKSAIVAIEWLQKVLSTKEADGKFIVALFNVPVASEIQITDDFRIVPFDSLNDSEQKRAIENYKYQTKIIYSNLEFENPSSALISPCKINEFLSDPNVESTGQCDEFSFLVKSTEEIILLLTLIGLRVPIQVSYWFNFDDPDLELAVVGQSRYGKIMEILPDHDQMHSSILDEKEAIEIISKFNKLTEIAQKKIRIATDRLKRALSRHQPADRAVEVSIAFEILCGDEQTSEMTHKVKVRAVRLLGGDKNVRDKNRSIISKTYDIRSKLVHQGIDSTKDIKILGETMKVHDVIAEACHLCAELIKNIIRRGAFPDWLHFDVNDHVEHIK